MICPNSFHLVLGSGTPQFRSRFVHLTTLNYFSVDKTMTLVYKYTQNVYELL